MDRITIMNKITMKSKSNFEARTALQGIELQFITQIIEGQGWHTLSSKD